jgi:plastocyanin
MSRAPLALALTTLVALAGCGGGDESSSSSEPATAPQTGTVDVGMNRLKFDPEDITVKTGAKIVWTNRENVPHDVAAKEGADFKSEVFGQGKTYEYTADQAGTISYVCTLHPGMDGTITVVD